MSDDVSKTSSLRSAFVALCVIGVLVVVDLALDYNTGLTWVHIGAELAVLVIAAAVSARLVRTLLRERRALGQLKSDLARAQEESQRWRQQTRDLVAGLGSAITDQFEVWALTDAEREIGLLLLKGLSLREIADLRQTSERTVREQARSLYRKAGLSGRASLSAYFLEDLFLPRPEA
ncbi:MAG: response regulator transcription factor [Pseudomonadales bacterium]|nr:response regulator transcription factor [Pseudomonadales bacterium]